MKSVLISIQPKWVEKIVGGKKTIEVRKTRPKIETPFKCYIYQTKKFVPVDITDGVNKHRPFLRQNQGKVIGEFICDRIIDIKPFGLDIEEFEKQSCLTALEITRYLKGLYGYGWHISDLKIYDKPKELSEFGQKCDMAYEIRCRDCLIRKGWDECCEIMCKPLKRPPQSWCYVESLGE